jgi:hypothetical protein
MLWKKNMFKMLMPFWVSAFIFGGAGSALAYCEEYLKEDAQDFELTRICASSIGQPFYRITQHIYDEGASLMFAFAPRSRKLLCHQYELKNEFYENCTNYGVNFFPDSFKGKKFRVTMLELSEVEPADIEKLYAGRHLFKYPEMAELVSVDNCFVVIGSDDKIQIGYAEESIIEMSQCLIEMETFISANKSVLK